MNTLRLNPFKENIFFYCVSLSICVRRWMFTELIAPIGSWCVSRIMLHTPNSYCAVSIPSQRNWEEKKGETARKGPSHTDAAL